MLTPTHKVPLNIRPQGILHCLVHLLALTIGLQMECRAKSKAGTRQVEQRPLKLADEARILIKNDDLSYVERLHAPATRWWAQTLTTMKC